MPIDQAREHRPAPRRPEQIVAEQRRRAKEDARETATAVAVKPAASTPAVATVDNRTPQQRYLDEVAPSSIVGRLVKFNKNGEFVTAEDGKPIDEDTEFFALCGETQIGWVRFNGEGEPPDRVMGLLYDNFIMPARESLGDLNPVEWSAGLSGEPEDPWLHQQNLVLQQVDTRELFTFSTTSKTGRRAVGNLLRHFDRMRRTAPDEVPIVRLKAGGFQHKDDRIGWVATPLFVVVGRAPRDDAAKPETAPPDTTPGGDMNDAIPF